MTVDTKLVDWATKGWQHRLATAKLSGNGTQQFSITAADAAGLLALQQHYDFIVALGMNFYRSLLRMWRGSEAPRGTTEPNAIDEPLRPRRNISTPPPPETQAATKMALKALKIAERGGDPWPFAAYCGGYGFLTQVGSQQGGQQRFLLCAIEQGQVDVVRCFLEHVPNALSLVNEGLTRNTHNLAGVQFPLHTAAQADDAQLVQLLLNCGASLNGGPLGASITAFHVAVNHASVHAVRALLAQDGISLDAPDPHGNTPLVLACKASNAIDGIKQCLILQTLIAKGANIRHRDHATQQTPLHLVLSHQFRYDGSVASLADSGVPSTLNLPKPWAQLITAGADVGDRENATKSTPFHVACRSGNVEGLASLIAACNDPESKYIGAELLSEHPMHMANTFGHSPLMELCSAAAHTPGGVSVVLEMIKMLLDEIEVFAEKNRGKFSACSTGGTEKLDQVLGAACFNEKEEDALEIIKVLLAPRKNGTTSPFKKQLKEPYRGHTPRQLAERKSWTRVVIFLTQ